jgi:hypothetical protein
MPMAEDAVPGDGFVDAVAPTVSALLDLAAAYHQMQARHGLVPAAESPAMADLAAEERFCRNGWREPVETAHSLSGLLCFAGIDHATGYAKLFASLSPPVPVYSHLAVARAALEAFAWGRWLADTTVDVDGRVKRGVVYRLDGNRSRRRIPELRTQAAEILQRYKDGLPSGWDIFCNSKQVRCGGVELPFPKAVIAQVLQTGRGPTPEDLGGLLWGYLSGISHSADYALMLSAELVEEPSDLAAAPVANLVTSARTVHLVGVTLLRAAIEGCTMRFRLYGWSSDEAWEAAVEKAEHHIQVVLNSASTMF